MATPVMQPNSTCGTISGTAWRLVRQYTTASNGEQNTTKIYKGPYTQLATAYASLYNTSAGARSITPSVSETSAISSIAVVIPVASAQWTPLSHEVKQPTYDIIPVEIETDMRCFYPGNEKQIEEIEKQIRAGTCAEMDMTGYEDAAKNYRKWRMMGMESYSRTFYTLRVQRFFDNFINLPDLTPEYETVNNCTAWANVRTLGAVIPSYIKEPRIVAKTGSGLNEKWQNAWASTPLSWRLALLGPQYQGKAVAIVWEFRGVIKWSQDHYYNGTWVAPDPTESPDVP